MPIYLEEANGFGPAKQNEEEQKVQEKKVYGVVDMMYNPVHTIKGIMEQGIEHCSLKLLETFGQKFNILEADYEHWQTVMYWLYTKKPEVFIPSLALHDSRVEEYYKKNKGIPNKITFEMARSLKLPMGFTYLQLDTTNMIIIQIEKYNEKYNFDNMSITILGLQASHHIEKMLKFVFEDSRELYAGRRYQHVVTSEDGHHDIAKKNLKYVTIKEETKKDLFDLFERWEKLQDVYEEMGVQHKCGILLYGPPGTGKTSLIRAIAGYLNMDILFLNAKRYEKWAKLIDEYGDGSIIVFEDIDYILDKKENSKNASDRSESLDRLGTALQILDGMFSPSNAIFIATTNHIEELDPNLIRDGRFDLKIEMDEFDEKLAKQMCETCKVPAKEVLKGTEYPLKPARLQNMILQYKSANYKKPEVVTAPAV